MDTGHSRRKRILSIDGGGFYGLSTLLVVEEILKAASSRAHTTPHAFQLFDLICGTSGGSLVALLLGGLKLDIKTAIEVYKQATRTLFGTSESIFWNSILNYSTFDYVPYLHYLEDVARRNRPSEYPHDLAHAKLLVPVMTDAPYYTNEVHHIRSYPPPAAAAISSTPHIEIWDATDIAVAGTAAKRFYEPPRKKSQIGIAETVSYRDAGFSGFSNPTSLAMEEAESLWPHNEIGAVISFASPLTQIVPRDTEGRITAKTALLSSYMKNHVKDIAHRAGPPLRSVNVKGRARLLANELIAIAIEGESAHEEVAAKREDASNLYHRVAFDTNTPGTSLVDCFHFNQVEYSVQRWLASADGSSTISRIVDAILDVSVPVALGPGVDSKLSTPERIELDSGRSNSTDSKPPSEPSVPEASEEAWDMVRSTTNSHQGSESHSQASPEEAEVMTTESSEPKPSQETEEIAEIAATAEPPQTPPSLMSASASLPSFTNTVETASTSPLPPSPLPVMVLEQDISPGNIVKFIRNFEDVRSPKATLLLATAARPSLPPLSLSSAIPLGLFGTIDRRNSQACDSMSSVDIPPAIETLMMRTAPTEGSMQEYDDLESEPNTAVAQPRGGSGNPTNMSEYLRHHKVLFIVANASSMGGEPWTETRDSLMSFAKHVGQVENATVDIIIANHLHSRHIPLHDPDGVQELFEAARPAGRIFLNPILQRVLTEYTAISNNGGITTNSLALKPLSIIVLLNDLPYDHSYPSLSETAQSLEGLGLDAPPVAVRFVLFGENIDTGTEDINNLIPGIAQNIAKVVRHDGELSAQVVEEVLLSVG